MPVLLSQTGVFADTASMKAAKALIPYDLIVAFGRTAPRRPCYVAIPKGQVRFSPDAEWQFPAGTVLVKTFELPVDAALPALKRRLETRLLVRARNGGVYGVVYKWRADGSARGIAHNGADRSHPHPHGQWRAAHTDLVLPEPARLLDLPHGRRRLRAWTKNSPVESHTRVPFGCGSQ